MFSGVHWCFPSWSSTYCIFLSFLLPIKCMYYIRVRKTFIWYFFPFFLSLYLVLFFFFSLNSFLVCFFLFCSETSLFSDFNFYRSVSLALFLCFLFESLPFHLAFINMNISLLPFFTSSNANTLSPLVYAGVITKLVLDKGITEDGVFFFLFFFFT